MDNQQRQQRIDKLIDKCLAEFPQARPCHDDWNRSWTEYENEVMVWFNVPLAGDAAAGMTTKAIKE